MRSLKARLITVAAIWVVASVAVAGVLLSSEFKRFLADQFYSELQEHLDEFEGLMAIDENGKIQVQRALSDPRYAIPLSGYYWEVQKNSAIVARSNSLEGPMLKLPVDGASNTQAHNHSIRGPTGELLIAERLRWLTGENEPVRIIIGTDKRYLDHVLRKFNSVLLWSLSIFSLSMIVVAGLLLIYAMAPIERLRTALANYHSGVTPDVRGRFPNEVQPLIDDLNSLIVTSGEQIQTARAQAGNIAHGLKTPLAILVDEADKLDEKGEHKSATVISDQCGRMQSQTDYQIARARAAASRAKPGTASSLAATAKAVARALERLHVERDVHILIVIPPSLMVACETEDLNEMLANLVDNACKHAKARVLLRTEAESPRNLVRVVVEDDGAGLPPEAWDVVFNVGERWDSRREGAGLGLPIVRDLVHEYGGDIKLGRSDLRGLKVVLDLPAISLPRTV